ncbi:MAG: tetratricopeptide repeat protein [Alphaproteobacteria bacterium]|nr:tetratricopeptide repeat protein [Alphaproteobacteria bacterium]
MKNIAPSLALMQQAVAHHQKGEVSAAEALYQKVLRLVPQHFDALRLLGGLYLQQNRADDAIGCLQQALAITPNHPELLNNIGVAYCSQGRLQDALNHYEQAVRLAPDYGDAIDNIGNIYYNAGKLDDAISWLTRSLTLRTDNPRAHMFLGHAYRLQNRNAEAATHYRQALTFWPDNTELLTCLGNILRADGQSSESCTIYQRLAALKPDDATVHLNLGVIYRDLGDLQAALAEYDTALRLRPNAPDILVNRAGVLIELDQPEEACTAYDAALQSSPKRTDAAWGKSLALLMLGQYREGWQLYETRFAYKPKPGPAPQIARWDGSNLTGKRLLIWGEQGLGDVLQFIRYAGLCKTAGAQVIVCCDKTLVKLLRNSPFIDAVFASDCFTPEYTKNLDFQIPVMSLPHLFGTTLTTIPREIPYLYVSPATQAKWTTRLAATTKRKIGLVWAGNPRNKLIDAHTTDRQRSLTLAMFQPILAQPDCQFYSLQKGEAAEQIAALGLQHQLIDLMPDVKDFEDTAAIVQNLDFVISVDTSVVHLAGGLGKPVWVLSRFGGCWRWVRNQENSPWYPSARVFGQTQPGDWHSCITRITNALPEPHLDPQA